MTMSPRRSATHSAPRRERKRSERANAQWFSSLSRFGYQNIRSDFRISHHSDLPSAKAGPDVERDDCVRGAECVCARKSHTRVKSRERTTRVPSKSRRSHFVGVARRSDGTDRGESRSESTGERTRERDNEETVRAESEDSVFVCVFACARARRDGLMERTSSEEGLISSIIRIVDWIESDCLCMFPVFGIGITT